MLLKTELAALLIDPADLRTQHENTLAQLRSVIEGAEAPSERAAAHLALANWHLAVPAARPATRWLLGLEQADDARLIAEAAEQALDHLHQARALLETNQNAQTRKTDSQLRAAAEALEPFARLFSAASVASDQTAYQSVCRDAAQSLAMARESENPDIEACALLWQSLAYHAAGRDDRALGTLPDVLAKPRQWPYDVMSRLLRCRVLAGQGLFTAALAQTVRFGAAVDRWQPTVPEQATAGCRQLSRVMQYAIGQAWLETLHQSTAPAGPAGLLENMLGTLKTELVSDQPRPGVYLLDHAVPIIIEPPDIVASQPSTRPFASQPASAPSAQPPHTSPSS